MQEYRATCWRDRRLDLISTPEPWGALRTAARPTRHAAPPATADAAARWPRAQYRPSTVTGQQPRGNAPLAPGPSARCNRGPQCRSSWVPSSGSVVIVPATANPQVVTIFGYERCGRLAQSGLRFAVTATATCGPTAIILN